jgi:hypothetical protein
MIQAQPRAAIPRVSRLDAEAFARDYLEPGRPVVIEGGAADWTHGGAWTPARLREVLGDRKVRVASSEHDTFGYGGDQTAYQVEEMEFGQAADLIQRLRPSPLRYYLMQQAVPREFPELCRELPVPPYVDRSRTNPNLWFGTESTETPLHYDVANNLFGQLTGRKRWTVFDPGQADLVYPRDGDADHRNLSRVSVEEPDLERFPLFARAQGQAGEVGPGDLLFLPAFWWHQVRSLEVSLSLNFWWSVRLDQLLTPMGRREVPLLFRSNRLMTLKGTVSAPEGGGFLGAARFFAERKEPALAVLFAAAALEEDLRLRYLKHVKPPDAAALREGARMADALAAAHALPVADADAVRQWSALVVKALADSEHGVEEAEAGAMIAGVADLTARRHR